MIYSALPLALLYAAVAPTTHAQCPHAIDLTQWEIAGPLGNGEWEFEPDGSQVTQNVNGQPTFVVSPKDMTNVRVSGKLRVDSVAEDNDYIGFVFGVQSPITYTNNITTFDCWMIDWKSDTQTSAEEGFSLIDLDYTFDFDNPDSFMPFFWTHNTISGFEITNTFFDEEIGWEEGIEYDIEFTLSPTRMTFRVDDVLIFDKLDCFEPGRFGFYNFSQAGTVFYDFEYEVIPQFTSPLDACLNESVNFQLLDNTCNPGGTLQNNVISQWEWDFGDDEISYEINPTHEFTEPGQYAATLTLTDEFGCESEVSHLITIDNGPTAAFSANSGCTGDDIEFTNETNDNGTTILSTQWDIDSDGTIDYVSPEITHAYDINGTYDATLIVTSQTCSDTVSQEISLFHAPTSSFLANQVGSSKTYEFTNLSADASSYLWNFGDPNTELDFSTEENPDYTYAENGEYDVVLTCYSSGGCENTYTLKTFVDVNDDTFIPTGFSPNGDGNNDVFRVLGYDFDAMTMHIFNQWGELVFTGTDYAYGWDGTANGSPAESGNYTYMIAATTVDGESQLYKGVVSLIR